MVRKISNQSKTNKKNSISSKCDKRWKRRKKAKSQPLTEQQFDFKFCNIFYNFVAYPIQHS